MQIVMVRLLGGLANQLFQYSMGRALAIRTGSLLRFDTRDLDDDILRNYALHQFNIKGQAASLSELDYFRAIGAGERYQLLAEKSFRFQVEATLAEAPVYAQGYWQSERYFESIEQVLRRDLTLTRGFSQEGASLVREIRSHRSSVSVHIRRGDYVTNPTTNAFHGCVSSDYVHRAMELMLKRYEDAVFYVFTDDLNWARENINHASNSVFIAERIMTTDGEELSIMGSCQHHILSNSSYSWWGAWLNPRRTKLVVAPTPWFRSTDVDPQDLYCANWVLLPI